MEHTNENQTEKEATLEQTVEEPAESRSEYQKRKRDAEKQVKRKRRKRILLCTFVVVVLAGILCGAVIASTMNISHNTVEIASANVQYVKHTVTNAVEQLADKLPWQQGTDDNLENSNLSVTNPTDDTQNDSENGTDSDNSDTSENSPVAEDNSSDGTDNTDSLVISENPFGIDPSKPMIALTFDDGPSKYTWSIVSTLYQYNARATFFLVGNRVATHQAAIDFILANHNEVASHSFSHANLVKSTDEEVLAQIQNTDNILQKQHAYTPALLRVPYGERDERVLEILRQEGKPVIGWSVDPRDWEVQDKDEIVKHVLSHVKDGDIILMHDLYKPTADAVAELIPELQKRGYQLVTVSELFQYKNIELIPGTYYYASWK